MKIQKKNWGGGESGGGVRGGGEREGSRWGGGGVRMDVIEELKFLGKFTKQNFRGRSVWGGGVRVGGSGWM